MNFSHRLTETITIAIPNGKSNSGDLTYATQTTVRARITRKTDVSVGPNGEQTTTNHIVETESEIPVDSRVWLPGANTSSVNAADRVISREYARTLDGSYILYIAYL